MKRTKIVIVLLITLLFVISCSEKKTTGPDQLPSPVFNPPAGSYNIGQVISITCATDGAEVRYTVDESVPTNSSTLYTIPLVLTSATTIKAKAFKSGWTDSPTETAVYTISVMQTVATPVFDPPGGTYNSAQNVTISTTTSNATILYTIDGNEPTILSPVYSVPIAINSNTTLKAKALKTGWNDSAVASSQYTFFPIPPAQFILIEGGTFNNGTSDITISDFYLDKYEITQSEYQAVMGVNPSHDYGVGSSYPVYYVSWFKAIEYCNLRSMQEELSPCYSYLTYGTDPANWPAGWSSASGNHANVSCNWTAFGYRLPTEMEWMFAARGGTQTHSYTYSGSSDINTVAWYSTNSSGATHVIGTKTANELGLFDMSGNVWEFVWDIYGNYPSGNQTNPQGAATGTDRGLRGGAWNTISSHCSVMYREYYAASGSLYSIGFRVCRNGQ
jgi:formylglycine-generating enzyme